MLTIGVPTKGTSVSLIRVLEHCYRLSSEFEVVVSINPGVMDVAIPATYLEAPNFKFIWQKDDLGLYGNFRFLLQSAQNQLFCWYCIDDRVSADILDICNHAINTESDLTIASWHLDEYDMNEARFDGNPKSGELPDLTNYETRTYSSLNIDPSWIFGVWKTSYLKKIYPKKNFDWLDCDILQRVILTGKTSIFSSGSPALVGTHYMLKRKPGAVNPLGHSSRIAIMRQLRRSLCYIKVGPSVMKLMLIRCWTLYDYSKKLNLDLRRNVDGEN